MNRPPLMSACIFAVALAMSPVLAAQEGNPAAARMQAMALEKEGRSTEAEQIWEGIVKADPRNAEALAHLGLLEVRQQHLGPAIDYYRRAAAINPDLPGLQLNMGLAFFKAAQFPDAIRSFSSEIKKHPGDQRLTILLGMAHYGMKDFLVASPYLQRAAERDPQSVALRLTLAHSCLASKQYRCVLDVHNQILALNAESPEADMLAAEASDRLGDGSGSAKELRAAIQLNPKEPNAHFGLGYLLWIRSKWAEAADEFQTELAIDPRHLRARIYLADSWVRLRQFAKALPELEALAASNPSEPLVHGDLGVIYADAGRTQDAIREFKAAVESDPGNADSHLELSRLYRSIDKTTEANAELDASRKLPPLCRPSLQEMIDSIENPTP